MFCKTSNLIFMILLFAAQIVYGARVTTSKNNKVMINLEGQEALINQNLYLINNQNKRVAVAKIIQAKSGKAVATIVKGKSDGTERVELVPMSNSASEIPTTSSSTKEYFRKDTPRISIVINAMNNAMTTRVADNTLPTSNTDTVAMKGMTYGLTGVVDWPLIQGLVLRGTLGYEPFKVLGTSKIQACDSLRSFECMADISYAAAGGYLRYDFYQSKTLFWGALGATMKIPTAKVTTALKMDDIQMTVTYAGAVGLDFFINHKFFIPVSIEQQMFLKSDTVEASILYIRAGFGSSF